MKCKVCNGEKALFHSGMCLECYARTVSEEDVWRHLSLIPSDVLIEYLEDIRNISTTSHEKVKQEILMEVGMASYTQRMENTSTCCSMCGVDIEEGKFCKECEDFVLGDNDFFIENYPLEDYSPIGHPGKCDNPLPF